MFKIAMTARLIALYHRAGILRVGKRKSSIANVKRFSGICNRIHNKWQHITCKDSQQTNLYGKSVIDKMENVCNLNCTSPTGCGRQSETAEAIAAT